ncbi:TetR/AcrR family transcriptional regulator [Planobispora takensis]|uniref:TetR family transcriptional regulator n=1 Tax=Planobispora takensis TaxID=1367882 RepID=A0A8J3WUN4_9ACTN|nr:TetR/AcrR family transcriptional regulator [Planobispora takensis]GII01763.1 TetR family transcriptional regulator [Planobispora takensis]
MRRTQEDRTRATRAALLAAARSLFAEKGYAAVPAEEIVTAAGVTRGALQHQFGDKRALFQAVFEELETELTARIATVTATGTWPALEKGITIFLDACELPGVRRIALLDAPAVLGWETWRQIESRHGLGLIEAALTQAVAEGLIRPQPTDVLARILLGAAIETALLVGAGHPRPEAEQALLTLLRGLRT